MTRTIKTTLGVAALAALAATALVTSAVGGTGQKRHRGETAVAKLKDPDGRTLAKVKLRAHRRGTVVVRVRARGLKPGFHGFHVHERGVCEAPSTDPEGKTGAFLSAGGHLRSGGQKHGHHAGDMPSLFVDDRGRARASFAIDSFRLADLADADGSAVMIHADADNFGNIPDRYASNGEKGPDEETLKTGDSGDRVACGIVRTRRR